ncbi:large conductance mechanosensitive channel protein MscL [Methylacidiphilum kamchatkense]|uniref:Large-conductance mechanosensitive channel n=1 Tax=Methylacidiphilum kamchatkense Kam1 TaxID=1202785 RepID=A0A516TJH4_9BACT|nr:large conductance mechanosensitive channel protein MscL [Methylacidiphilum kamchatkense]QDQ41363.1 large conductance mechanosensitive channel [Methylacidiphilum kamchatkense Kam1]
MQSFLKEFKEFAFKGNAIDMAVGVVVGTAFNQIVSSFVNDIIMPPLGVLIGGVDFKNLQLVLVPIRKDALGKTIPEVAIHYGLFINAIVQFFIICLSVFIAIKFVNKMLSMRLPQKDQ